MSAGGWRLFKFVVVGGGAAAALAGFTFGFLRVGLKPLAAGLAAYVCAFAIAYLLQRNWTFDGAGRHSRTLPRYLLVQAVCATTSALATHIFVDRLDWPALISAVAMTVVVSTASFLASSLWVFRETA